MSRSGQLAIYTTHMGNIQGGCASCNRFEIPHTRDPLTGADIDALKKAHVKKMQTNGGNPALIASALQAAPAISNAIGSIAKPVSDAIGYVNNVGDRLVKKGELTGKYSRIASRNDRFASRKNLANDINMAKSIMSEFKKAGSPITLDQAMKMAKNY